MRREEYALVFIGLRHYYVKKEEEPSIVVGAGSKGAA
jgi:hypothetical protein